MRHTEATIVLPGRFHPRHLKKDPRGERDEETFVQTLVEYMVAANGSSDFYRSSRKPRLAQICFTHFGEHEQTVTHFFNRAVGIGAEIGTAVAEARRLTMLPPNDKTPLLLAEQMLGAPIMPRSSTSPIWRRVKKHRFGSSVTASVLYGSEGLRKAGFGLISAVGRGSNNEPCFLRLRYRPKDKKEGTKKLSLLGKGVVLDTGGLDLKTDGSMERMHYDMAGAATVASVFGLAVEHNLPLDLVALLPLVENAIGNDQMRIHEVIRAYDGQTVEITNTDAEGRLILADALAYSEKQFRPDATVTVATLCDMADFGPDFLKVMVNTHDLERRAKVAEGRSHEKMVLFPRPEHFGGVDELFVSKSADLQNESSYHYHAGMIFLTNFLHWDPSPWLYMDVAATMESDADDYGAGPGFGVRFLWQFVKQFART